MDRPIVYTQEQVRNYDHMENGWSSMVIGNSNLFADLTGAAATSIAGFTPSYNSNLTVTFGAGRIYALAPMDASAYGGWPANTAQIYQQGQNPIQTLTFDLSGLSAGQSRWALVEVAYAQADIIPANDPTSGVLTYYNPANPTQPLVGPNNSGTPQPTLRQAQAVLTIKYGAVATTGSETPPTVDSGNVPMYLVHLTFGQSSITSANLFVAGPAATPNPPTYDAPFITGLFAVASNTTYLKNFFVDPCCRVAQIGTASPPTLTTSKKYGCVDLVQMWASGGTVSAGTITQDSTGIYGGSTPYACVASGVTTGAGASINARRWLESADAQSINGNTCTVSCLVYQDTGASQNITLQVNAPTVINNFSSVTNVGTSSAISVASGVKTKVSFTLNMTASLCWRGIEVIASCGFASQTAKNFAVTDWCINIGTQVANFAVPEFALDLANAMRYYEQTYEYGTLPATVTNNGMQVTAPVSSWNNLGVQSASVGSNYMLPKIITPAVTVYSPTSGASGNIHDNTAGADKAVTPNADTRRFYLTNSSGGTIAAADYIQWHFKADARL